MKTILAVILAAAMSACGGGGTDYIPVSSAQAQTPPTPQIYVLSAVLRLDATNTWIALNDNDHATVGITYVEQGTDELFVRFDRAYTHASSCQVSTDDDYHDLFSVHCGGLGVSKARITFWRSGRQLSLAEVNAIKPPGVGNLWFTAVMVNK